jgi:ankyrin repeat protein
MMLEQPGCKVNEPDSHGNTALHAAAAVKGDVVAPTKLLMEHGADHKVRNETGLTPLAVALGAANKKVVKQLREAGVTDAQSRIMVPE